MTLRKCQSAVGALSGAELAITLYAFAKRELIDRIAGGSRVRTLRAPINLPLLRSLFGVVRPLAECQWFGVEPIAAGVFGVPAGCIAASAAAPSSR